MEAFGSELLKLSKSKVFTFRFSRWIALFFSLNVLIILLVQVVLVCGMGSVMVIFVEPSFVEESDVGNHSISKGELTSNLMVFLDIDICYSHSSIKSSEQFVPGGEEFAAKLYLLGIAEQNHPVSGS